MRSRFPASPGVLPKRSCLSSSCRRKRCRMKNNPSIFTKRPRCARPCPGGVAGGRGGRGYKVAVAEGTSDLRPPHARESAGAPRAAAAALWWLSARTTGDPANWPFQKSVPKGAVGRVGRGRSVGDRPLMEARPSSDGGNREGTGKSEPGAGKSDVAQPLGTCPLKRCAA